MAEPSAAIGAVLRVPLVDLAAQYRAIREDIDPAIQRVLDKTSFILGEEVRDFEAAFARYTGAEGAVGVASGTAALELAFRALGLGPGDEIITTAHTFIATAEAISNVGARPVFADIEADTYNIDPEHVEELVNERTRAILPVHLYGRPARLDALSTIARRHGLMLVEDAAQAHGAEIDGVRVGSIGDAACFSFYPGKNLGAYGDAGAVTSNDPALLDRIRRLRDHGRTTKYEHAEIGYAERMDALQAAILSAKLPHLERWTEARRAHARRYGDLLAGLPLTLPAETADRHVFHLYVIRVERRDELLRHLADHGIAAGVHYPIPLHRQPAYLDLGYGAVRLPRTEQAAAEILSLPMYPELEAEQQSHVANVIRSFYQ